MTDDFENLNSRIPDLSSILQQRIISRKQTAPTTSVPQPFDPYKAILKKKEEELVPVDPSSIKQWPQADLEKLEEYCRNMGIFGFSCGKMHPIAALAYLKSQFGEDFTNIPLEERIPSGYQKISPSNSSVNSRQILHG